LSIVSGYVEMPVVVAIDLKLVAEQLPGPNRPWFASIVGNVKADRLEKAFADLN
jgi:hypothetical protein